MQILDQAVEVMRKQGADGARAAAALEAIAASGEEAARIWQGYLNSPGAPGDKYTVVSWVGSERARQLYDLSLKAKEQVKAVCAAAGAEARFLVLDESPIVLAYGGLKEGETGPQAAQAALAMQQATNKHLRGLADKVRSVKPGAAKKAAPRPAGKAPTKKPTAKKKPATKKSAPKKPATKKKVAKKAPKKK